MLAKKRIYIAGHQGMVGSALVEECKKLQNVQLILRSRKELDLLDAVQVDQFFSESKPDQVFIAAAKVGGIQANDNYPADFIYENLRIQNNLVSAAYKHGVNRLLMLGSSCIYPKLAKQPMSEEMLLTGPLESTNEPYAVAKIAGIKLCESYNRQYGTDYRSVMPTNLYGPKDNFHPDNSHVVPAMMQSFHRAKMAGAQSVVVWGSGKPKREFLYVKDMAKACLHVMNISTSEYWSAVDARCSHVNIGTGRDCTIRELAEHIRRVVGYDGQLIFDDSKPDGTPRKLLDIERITSLGWRFETNLDRGLEETYAWFLKNQENLRGLNK